MDTKVEHHMVQVGTNAQLLSLDRIGAPLSVAISCRDDALTVRNRLRLESSADPYLEQQQQQPVKTRCVKKSDVSSMMVPNGHQTSSTAVSRRNARERKRVRLVNLGFATLREHVPAGSKTKKLSKVETLRSAISYIRHLQSVLGDKFTDYHRHHHSQDSNNVHDDSGENYMSPQSVILQEDNSSTSDDMMVEIMSIAPHHHHHHHNHHHQNGANGGVNNDSVVCSSSPASSTEGSFVASPYEEPPLMDIGSWFT